MNALMRRCSALCAMPGPYWQLGSMIIITFGRILHMAEQRRWNSPIKPIWGMPHIGLIKVPTKGNVLKPGSPYNWRELGSHVTSQNEDSLFFIDSSIVKAHRAATGAKRGELAQDIGRSRGGRTSKVHAVVDESGRPRCLIITGVQVHDSKVMIDLLDGAGESAAVVADKAYNSRSIRQRIADQGSLAVIPTKSNARNPIPHDKGLYRMRNIVERFFCTMKDMRRLTTRYEKLSANFLAMVHIFAIRLWVN